MNSKPLLVLAALCCTGCNPVAKGDVFTAEPPLALTDAGTPCTPWSDAANWPVRVVFVVENGGKMCVLDPPGAQPSSGFCDTIAAAVPGVTVPGRLRVIAQFIAANATRPNVSVAVVAFHDGLTVLPFRPVADGVHPGLAALQSDLGKASDLQGGLAAAKALVEEDVLLTPASLRPRTRSVVVVLSSGLPFPRCASDDGLAQYASPTRPELVWADSPGAGTFCNQGPVDVGSFQGFTLGGDRNQNAELAAAVTQLVGLDAQYGLGEVRVHTRLLLSADALAACGPVCADLLPGTAAEGRAVGSYTLSTLASLGGGTFVDPGEPQAVTVDSVDTAEFTSFCPHP